MKYVNKSFSIGMPRVTQEQWDAIFKKKRQERQQSARENPTPPPDVRGTSRREPEMRRMDRRPTASQPTAPGRGVTPRLRGPVARKEGR